MLCPYYGNITDIPEQQHSQGPMGSFCKSGVLFGDPFLGDPIVLGPDRVPQIFGNSQ